MSSPAVEMAMPGPATTAPAPSAQSEKSKDNQEVEQKVARASGGQNPGQQLPQHHMNSNRGGGMSNKRKRGGPGPGGPGRNSFAGRGGQFHHGGGGGGGGFPERRPFPHSMGGGSDFDVPLNKKSKVQNPEFRIFEKLRAIQGSTADLPPNPFELKKFLANTRLYIGNIAPEVTELEIKDLFSGYGEVDEVFINRDKNFAFLKLDYRTNAERARAELDQFQLKNRLIKVRFAPATVRIKVKNLNPMVSNELLLYSFSVFGDIERALVFVDEKGKSNGEGIVDFTRKNNAALAHKWCTEKCFFITSDLRPVVTEVGDMAEMDEGLLEMNLPKRDFKRGGEMDYHQAREIGPRFAEEGSFEEEYGEKYKSLVAEFKGKELALKEELQKEVDQLQNKMEIARYDYETEMLRQQLRQRELDQERHKIEFQSRVSRNFGGFPNGGNRPGPGGGGMEAQSMEQGEAPGDSSSLGGGFVFGSAGSTMPLAPPPMPPQGLMAHLQVGEQTGGNSGPTWEIGPFGFGRGEMGGFGGRGFRNDDGPRFMGPGGGGRGGPRGGGAGFGGLPRATQRPPFRGNRGGRR